MDQIGIGVVSLLTLALPGRSLSLADQTNALADLRLEGAQAPQAQAQLTLRGSKYQQTTVSSAP